eukprot:1159375-Pelagomonas_calceolata.AAC.3
MSDMKLKGPSFETLTIIAEAVGPQFVSTMLHKKAAGHKNPKVRLPAPSCFCCSFLCFVQSNVLYGMFVCMVCTAKQPSCLASLGSTARFKAVYGTHLHAHQALFQWSTLAWAPSPILHCRNTLL